MAVMASAWLIVGIAGAASVNGALALFGFGMCAFFGIGFWWLSPLRIHRRT
jgi:hypothetical protein